jgi:hypothetical protein
VDLPLPGYFARGDLERAARYRTLRQLADAGLDHERERMFFKGEVRSRRWVEDKVWHAAFWMGLAYDAFSDFGRSVTRPLALWLASVAAATFFYLTAAMGPEGGGAVCLARQDDPTAQALFLATKNALVVLANYRDHRVTRAYHCLFGGAEEAPNIPVEASLAEIGHTLWSALLIFVLLQAVRNQFRIR